MNIGIICYPTFGGSGVVATELGRELAKKGNTIHFISYDLPARLDFFSEYVYYHQVNVSLYPLFQYPPYELALTGKIIEVVQNSKLDLVHVHYAIPHAAAAVMAKKILKDEKGIKLPVVTTLHGTDITLVGKDPNYESVVSYSLNQSDIITSVSDNLKQDTYNFFNVNKDINVIPNFIDLEKFKPICDKNLIQRFAQNNEKIIIHASNFRKVKRIEDVIAIFEKIVKKIDSKLILVGDGPERQNIEKKAKELNLTDKILFLGNQDAIEKILPMGDLFLMPSETESFGLAALEAMACGMPVISSNSGGLPELNHHGFSGYTAHVGDIDTMSHYAITLLADDLMLSEFKKKALIQAQKFAIHQIIPKYEAIYQSIF